MPFWKNLKNLNKAWTKHLCLNKYNKRLFLLFAIWQVGLTEVADTLVEDSTGKGISGGEVSGGVIFEVCWRLLRCDLQSKLNWERIQSMLDRVRVGDLWVHTLLWAAHPPIVSTRSGLRIGAGWVANQHSKSKLSLRSWSMLAEYFVFFCLEVVGPFFFIQLEQNNDTRQVNYHHKNSSWHGLFALQQIAFRASLKAG